MRFTFIPILFALSACTTNVPAADDHASSIQGTWKLISGTTIQEGDTTHTDYTKDQEMIKIITDTHFAFLNHDLQHGADSASASFVAGGGTYDLDGNHYTEHLDYCNYREWEGNAFEFDVKFDGDTLTQQGKEKVEGTGIDRIIIETYVRIPDNSTKH